MKKVKLINLFIIIFIILSGCTTAKFSNLQLTKELPTFEVVEDFEKTVKINKFLGFSAGKTLLNLGEDNTKDPVFDAIQREIAKVGGDAAVDITITYGASFADLLLNTITGTIYSPAYVKITGTVVKY